TATETEAVIAAVAVAVDAIFAREGDRYLHRDVLAALMRPWFEQHSSREVDSALTEAGVLWSRYRTMADVVADFDAGWTSGGLAGVDQPGIGPVISARSPIRDGGTYGPTV